MSSSPDPFQSYFDSHEPKQELESPFLNEEYLADEARIAQWRVPVPGVQLESPFLEAFEDGWRSGEVEEYEEFLDEWDEEEFEDEAIDEEFSLESEMGILDYEEDELYAEGLLEHYYVEGKSLTLEKEAMKKNLPNMKFEFQTRNHIFRNDGKSQKLLDRKYGPKDFLVDGGSYKKGAKLEITLESETGGVLEFETGWLRKWDELKASIKKAVQMTQEMNDAPKSKFNNKRKEFPFDVSHLRTGSAKEMQRGFWYSKPGMEGGDQEKILGKEESLEVEINDPKWIAGIQSSESFLLEQYESYLIDHEWPHYKDNAIKYVEKILSLDIANTRHLSPIELLRLRNFLLIITNYIMRGQGGEISDRLGAFIDVNGKAAKQAFTLMSRTKFSSIYTKLLSLKAKKSFVEIVQHDLILKMIDPKLNRKSMFFIKGYGLKTHHQGPTIYDWLVGIYSNKDLLSGISDAMGRYPVKTEKRIKDRYLVKFETRNTTKAVEFRPDKGGLIESKDWVEYAATMYYFASKRRRRPVDWILLPLKDKAEYFLSLIANGNFRDAVSLAHKQGITDEKNLTDLIFQSLHPELGGRLVGKEESHLAQKWQQIRNELVLPFLPLKGSHEIAPFLREDHFDLELRQDYEYDDVNLVADDITDREFEEDESDSFLEDIKHEFADDIEHEHIDYEAEDQASWNIEAHELDPMLVDLAEKTFAQESPLLEHDSPSRWTKCFSAADIGKVQKVYEENTAAAISNSNDRCSCIVMLNVALGQLLSLRLKKHRARGKPPSTRFVEMANLTTESIEKAMKQLNRKGFAHLPMVINFYDRRNKTAGTLKPKILKTSVRDEVLAKSTTKGCWFAFALSIMDGYHSVLLLVDNTSATQNIYWLDQFSNSLDSNSDVTNNLDQKLTEKTQSWWQSVMDLKNKGYNTTIRIWQLKKPL
jgi:hypothetical protein